MYVILNHYALGSGQKQAHRGFFAGDKMPCMSRSVQIELVWCRGRNRVFIFSFSKKYLMPALVSNALRHSLFFKKHLFSSSFAPSHYILF